MGSCRHIHPGWFWRCLVRMYRHRHTPVEAGSTGQDALKVVNGQEAGGGFVEGQELAVHGAPAAARWPLFSDRLPSKPE